MRVSYRRQHALDYGQIPDFLRSEFVSGTWERTGFDFDFPALSKDPMVAAAVGYKGRNFLAEAVEIARWYNRDTKVIVGSIEFSEDCEGPPGVVHGGAVASALDDILGVMVWREAGFSRAGIPTMQLNVRYRGPAPMGRQLRFDTHVVKREGRKVFAKAVLRDPTSGEILAEGEGLFFVKKPTPTYAARKVATLDIPRKATDDGRAPGPPPLAAGAEESRRWHPTPETISYDEAIRHFGVGNPGAAENIVAFYAGDLTAMPPAKL